MDAGVKRRTLRAVVGVEAAFDGWAGDDGDSVAMIEVSCGKPGDNRYIPVLVMG